MHAISGDVGAKKPPSWRRKTFLILSVISAIGALLFLAPWLYVRLHGPLHQEWHRGSMVFVWQADGDGIECGAVQEPPGGVPPPQGTGTSSAAWPLWNYEWF